MKTTKIVVIMGLILTMVVGCSKNDINPNLDTSKDVQIAIAGPWVDWKAMETVTQAFHEKYPNCTVNYEYVQDYENISLKRLEKNDNIDLFVCGSIQPNSDYYPYTVELNSIKDLDLSNCFDGLLSNFSIKGSEGKELYSIPYGGEVRGMIVNKTLLNKYDLTVPTNATELLDACKTLRENGLIAMQGNPGNFSALLLYPYICNIIANNKDYDKAYKAVNTIDESMYTMFDEPLKLLYDIMANDYYKYKYVETELGLYTDISNEGVSKSFLNIINDQKVDDIGQTAFLPLTMSTMCYVDQFKEDYHSNIDYEFILSPVTDNGGCAYLSPTQGLAINKNSKNLDWVVEFMNFLFSNDTNKSFNKDNNTIPNTTDAFDYMSKLFDIDQKQISQLGQVTFDYDFYSIITSSTIDISKGNNPKYMDNGELYDFTYYTDHLKESLESQRTSLNE